MKHYFAYDRKHPDKNTDSIVFPNRSDAEAVLNVLDEDIELFGRTSLEKFHSLCLLSSTEEEKTMGWDEEEFAKVYINRTRAGYAIIFPKPKAIKPIPELKEIFPNCNFAELQYKNCSILDSVNERLRELSEKGYVTPGEILEATEPIRTGYDWVPENYEWPKMPENWLDEVSKQKVYIVECYWDNGEMYEDFMESTTIEGVFSTKGKAEMYIQSYTPEAEIEYNIIEDVTEDGIRHIRTRDNDEYHMEDYYRLSIKEMEVQ